MIQEQSITAKNFTASSQVNQVAISGMIQQLTQFPTASGQTMSLGSIEGVGNRGKVIIEFSDFGNADILKVAQLNGIQVLLEGDLKMYKGKQPNAQFKIQVDVQSVTVPRY